MAANKKALAISGLMTFGIFAFVAGLILGFVFAPKLTLILLGLAIGGLIVFVIGVCIWESLYDWLVEVFKEKEKK